MIKPILICKQKAMKHRDIFDWMLGVDGTSAEKPHIFSIVKKVG